MRRSTTDPHTASEPFPATVVTNFYREEFQKHLEFLRLQRECYSERAVANAEAALDRILSRIDELCLKRDANRLVSRLLRRLDSLTGVSAWSDPKKAH
ncbi:MAG: hypothetical protein AB1806_05960 [Acidobacteriota bacterium]